MTVIFGYFHYIPSSMFFLTTLQGIISAMLGITLNIFILRSSKSLPEEIRKTRLLKSAAIINLTFIILNLALPAISYSSPTEIEKIIITSYIIFLALVGTLPAFITFGIFFFIFGKANKEKYSMFLMLAGVLWMVSLGANVIILDGNLLNIINLFTYPPIDLSMPFSLFRTMLFLSFIIINLNGHVLLIFHGNVNKDKNLMIAGIIGINASIFIILYYFIIPLIIT